MLRFLVFILSFFMTWCFLLEQASANGSLPVSRGRIKWFIAETKAYCATFAADGETVENMNVDPRFCREFDEPKLSERYRWRIPGENNFGCYEISLEDDPVNLVENRLCEKYDPIDYQALTDKRGVNVCAKISKHGEYLGEFESGNCHRVAHVVMPIVVPSSVPDVVPTPVSNPAEEGGSYRWHGDEKSICVLYDWRGKVVRFVAPVYCRNITD